MYTMTTLPDNQKSIATPIPSLVKNTSFKYRQTLGRGNMTVADVQGVDLLSALRQVES